MSKQSFFGKFKEKLSQPVVIASCASVGAHVLLYAALPGLPIAYQQDYGFGTPASEGEPEPDVSLIELSPGEISRIPDLSPPPPPPPLPQIKPLPNVDQLLPQRPVVPPNTFSGGLPPIPPNPLSAPRLRLNRPRRRVQLPSTPPLPPPLPLPAPRRRTVAINPGLPGVPGIPGTNQSPQQIPSPPNLPFGDGNTASIDNILGSSNWRRNPGIPPQSPGNVDKPNEQPNGNNPANTNNSSPTETPQQIAARIQQNRTAAGVARLAKLRENYRRNDANTSEEDVQQNTNEWSNQVAQVANSPQAQTQQRTISGNYPKSACRLKIQDTVTSRYGLVVNAQGNIDNLRQLKSAGYPIFDKQAESTIRSRGFSNSNGVATPYIVTVNFTPPQDCGGFRPQPPTPPQATPQPQTPTLPQNNTPAPPPPPPAPKPPAVQPAPPPPPPAPKPPAAQPAPPPPPPAPEPPAAQPAPPPPPPAPEPPAAQPAPPPPPPAPEPPAVQTAPVPQPEAAVNKAPKTKK